MIYTVQIEGELDCYAFDNLVDNKGAGGITELADDVIVDGFNYTFKLSQARAWDFQEGVDHNPDAFLRGCTSAIVRDTLNNFLQRIA